MPFALGQRWISDSESELGLGTLVAIDARQITLMFTASGEQRHYAKQDAPVTRVRFNPGDTIESGEGWQLTVASIEETSGLITYLGSRVDTGESTELRETLLSHELRFNKPQDKLFAGQIDKSDRFATRYQCWQTQLKWQRSPLRGLVGARIGLVPHQLHIAHEAGKRHAPRLLLADEVGLGKTIEAGLIIHQQLLTGRAQRIIAVVPEALLYQWLVEMLRRFNLRFSIFDAERCEQAYDEAINPFETEQLILCTPKLLRKKQWLEQAVEAGWDTLVVDEAHHLAWAEDNPSRDYQVVETLAQVTPSVLLLTATPDQLGHESHFARLRLLDPDRFYSYDAFVSQEKGYREVADAADALLNEDGMSKAQQAQLAELLTEQDIEPQLKCLNADVSAGEQASARNELLSALLDRHGTSRVMFRNSRSAISGFPGRQLCRHTLTMPEQYQTAIKVISALSKKAASEVPDSLYPERVFQQFEGDDASWWQFDPRVSWLLEQLKGELKQEKVLIICSRKQTAEQLETALRQKEGIRTGVFHEDMSILERDRAAAYFADMEEGAQVLVCSEIGSEGRNFQFAAHLVLFDLPAHPDLLEQRIGRLDRIGQTRTINVHAPYFADSSQARLLDWYDQGLQAFEQINPCGDALYREFEERLWPAASQSDEAAWTTLLKETTQRCQILKGQLEQGRDRLLELHSSGHGLAEQLADAVKVEDMKTDLPSFMFSLFDTLGIHQEDGSQNVMILRPSEHMLLPHVPGLPDDGVQITFDRQTALSREDVQLMTWDHPMVSGILEQILTGDTGSVTVSLLANKALPAGTVLVELIYVAEAIAPKHFQMGRFLPPTPIRLLLDKNGKDLAANVPFDGLQKQLSRVNRHTGSKLAMTAQSVVHPLLAGAETTAQQEMVQITNAARQQINDVLDLEQDRLLALKAVNPAIRDDEIAFVQEQKQSLLNAVDKAQVKLDAIRLIVVSHNG
ncbi:RNA polymerase-associated protein RapA [Corallincola holothuriorum]|uniref:RNA polymerase-associated protein RapA n=1 Tax=Corallincola holothuriorum TaxID=2282215 RepID=A0A368NQA4_9GAMM|nr:RNA polymerase-associated protein RapA [Corallincola holothuriorum]RCU51659.1 RNA polymerase-associated protein RapA [Corallincola holothuriorum]